MSRIINQLLDLSRIEAGKMEWHMAPLDLCELAGDAERMHQALFTTAGVSLSRDGNDSATPLLVVADRDKLIQVFTNLLSNAAKFTPCGGQVRLSTYRVDQQAVAEVEDSGVGIAADQIDAIFERFRQGGDALSTKPEGAGLGLPISREIAHHHGGSLTVRSTPGRGSCFRLALPLAGEVPTAD